MVFRKLVLIVEGTSADEIELTLSYVVGNAIWTPTYDVRVLSNEKKMQVRYRPTTTCSLGCTFVLLNRHCIHI